ncbi:DHA2 family efflux MFS transporter permease subunit [Marinomonas mediterranea]|jgi:drug resistance transporter, EmrB/QacA subfamily|uniref:Drug resistance transporter, EmrB/QacA subfamily n=1 Tax=Marinomonas mediterranea (strain ATCC 700492 / JCM 21426 / NBRC 103028 / MMB-1) TaxID=717774 RepID=F2JW86_MARM1|nr:DHA2 family efflux MFS transporter permease subunit [Marinomonas mediterranea]ADZ89474.1 drug resistance transporter, EmrB/QacA subfamily [Marinomonas mediterranea MMB-1]WCN15724.1 DHA2 family efflux MFS transporter permease subunit [Marinomonas mediterranea MMB-1]
MSNVSGAVSVPVIEGSRSVNRFFITISVMLATIMQALDTTIANVALPHMQGAMGTTQDQISWVLTSYIVAAAICMPLAGILSARLGRKRIFLWSVVGFTVSSVLCGLAQSLDQIILFRILQGVFGASLVPLSQSVLLDSYPKEKHGSAMAMWGVGVMVGPILGPYLGGVLTEYYNWRWVFYINVPFGILAWFGIAAYVKETALDSTRKFDFFGFVLLSIAIGCLQMMLDRGEGIDWFNSLEIVIEAILTLLAGYMFLVHINTSGNPFIDPVMFKDRNFSVGLVFIFIVGVILLATMALLPPFMQNLMGYPVIDVGTLLAPRGFGSMLAMLMVGKLSQKVDPRLFILIGLSMISWSMWQMTKFNLNVSGSMIVGTGMVQGAGLGLIFVPLSTIAFTTLNPIYRNEGTALFSLLRNIGSSIGISLVSTYLSQRIQINHAAFSEFITPFNLGLKMAESSGTYSIHSSAGLVALNQQVNAQAATLAYLQDFRLMMWVTILTIPLVFFLKAPKR